MAKNKHTIQANSLNGLRSSEKTNKQTKKQKQQLEWIQSGSVVYFKVRNCLVLRPKCIVDREGPGRRRAGTSQGGPGCRCFLKKGELLKHTSSKTI